jgi:GNAT superfamily N-acetyltransferase
MIDIRVNFKPANYDLNKLNQEAWGDEHADQDYTAVLARSLGYVCAFSDNELIAFVNVAWDGGKHAFILDTCVSPKFRRRGIASIIVKRAIALARDGGVDWVHVDYEDHLETLYRNCGFRPTLAGLVDLRE